MKTFCILLLVLSLMIAGMTIVPVQDTTHELAPISPATRATLIVGAGQAYTTIQSAINAASNGDTVRVYAGMYKEHVMVNKALAIIGNGTTQTIINGTNTGNATTITATGCTMAGVSATGSNIYPYCGVTIQSSRNRITDCNFSGNYVSIFLFRANNNTIRNCTGHFGTGYGLIALYSNDLRIVNCSFNTHSWHGIDIRANSNRTIIENCTTIDSDDGIYLQGTYYIKVLNCTSERNANSNMFITASNYDQITNCTIRYGDYNGILLNSKYNTITGCNISSNLNNGIYATAASYCNITCNRFLGNTKEAIYYYSSTYSSITYNLFIGNNGVGKQAYDDRTSNNWNTSFIGNYWSDWTTPDSNLDGIVDTPYVLGGTASVKDLYPLANLPGAPIITTVDNKTAIEDVLYYQPYSAFDMNTSASQLSWGFKSNAGWLSFSGGKVLQGMPTNALVGSYWVNISVSDGHYTAITNFTITVQNVNDPPTITVSDVITAVENALYSVDFNATDIDPTSDVMTWSLKSNATFLSINAVVGVLSGTPGNSDVGGHWVNVTVSDGKGGLASHNFTLVVQNLNDPPGIITTPIATCYEHVSYYCLLSATDPDPTGDTLTWALNTNTSFLSITSDGNLSGTPSQTDVGIWWVNVSVSDGHGGSDAINFTLTVINLNDPPDVKNAPANFSFDEDTVDESIELNEWFTDPDVGDVLEFTCGGESNITVTILPNGTVRLEPKANWSGIETLTFYAEDIVLEVSDSVKVTVLPVNDAPFDPVIITDSLTIHNDEPLLFEGNASDVDIPYGDVLTYEWFVEDWKLPISQERTCNATGTYRGGLNNYTLVVTDSAGANCSARIQIIVLSSPSTDDDVTPDDDVDDDTDDDTDDDVVNETDTDNDTLPDSWEMDHFGNLTYGPNDDPDTDGLTNLEEYQQDKDPGLSDDDDTTEDPDRSGGTSFLGSGIFFVILGVITLVIIFIIVIAMVVLTRRKRAAEQTPPGAAETQPTAVGSPPGLPDAQAPAPGPQMPAAMPQPAQQPQANMGQPMVAPVQPAQDGQTYQQGAYPPAQDATSQPAQPVAMAPQQDPNMQGVQPQAVMCQTCGQPTLNYPGQGNWCQTCQRYV